MPAHNLMYGSINRKSTDNRGASISASVTTADVAITAEDAAPKQCKETNRQLLT